MRTIHTAALLATTGLATTIGCSASSDDQAATNRPASLQSELDQRRSSFNQQADADTRRAYDQGVRQVGTSGVMSTALREGDRVPAFSLPDARGNTVRFADVLAQGPAVVTWYRGGWCPYCNIQLKAYQDILPELRAEGAQLVAISPETPDNSLTTVEKNELDYVVLSDEGLYVADDFGIAYELPEVVKSKFKGRLDLPAYNGDDSWRLPLAVTYVVDRDGIIRYAFLSEDYRERAEPSEILRAVRSLN